jgi:hypothetical protein
MAHCLLGTVLFLLAPTAGEKADIEAIKKTVFDAQLAGWERHSIGPYMAQWSDDARVIVGRSENPGKYDLVLSRDQLEATRRMLFQDKPSLKLVFENARVEVKGNKAVLRVQTTWKVKGSPEFSQAVQEVYRLRRTGGGWKVWENRAWLTSKVVGTEVRQFDEKTWKKLDARVEELRGAGSGLELAFALCEAYRFAEAHQTAQKYTSAGRASADDWRLRAFFALQAGDAKDAKMSLDKAQSLDKKTPAPSDTPAKQ